MKYFHLSVKSLIIIIFCLMNTKCSEYEFEIVDDFVARINGQTMNLLNVSCSQVNNDIGLTANGGTYDFAFIIPETLKPGKYPLSLSSTIVSSFIIDDFTFLSPEKGQFQFSRKDGILHGIFSFTIDDPTDPYDVNGYFHVEINVIED